MALVVAGSVVLDCSEPEKLAAFYKEFLDGEETEATANRVEIKGADGMRMAFRRDVNATPPSWPRPENSLQAHVDFHVEDMDAESTANLLSRWIADGTAGAILDAIRAEAMARRALAESILPADNIVTKPEAFHLWLRLPETWSRGEFTAHLRTRGIAAVASDAFATTPETPDALRVCLGAAAGREETRQVLEIIADALDQLPSSAGVII